MRSCVTVSYTHLDVYKRQKLPEGDYDTLGGFIISLLGFLPVDGDMNTVQYKNIRFTVLNVEERRIGKVKVEFLPEEHLNFFLPASDISMIMCSM